MSAVLSGPRTTTALCDELAPTSPDRAQQLVADLVGEGLLARKGPRVQLADS